MRRRGRTLRVVAKDEPSWLQLSCGGCDSRWYGPLRAHCGLCHVTLDDVATFDIHRHDGVCSHPQSLGMIADRGGVWRELLASPEVRAS